jgi:hypothetical protein
VEARRPWVATQRARAPAAGDEPVGELQDLRAGAVVLGQGHRPGARMPLGEAQQELGRGAGEGVDRLVRVADDRQIARLAQPQLEEPLESGFVSWYSSTLNQRLRDRTSAAASASSSSSSTVRRACPRSRAGRPLSSPARSRGRRGRTGRPGSAPDRRLRDPAVGLDAPDLRPFDRVGHVLRRREAISARQPADERHEQAQLRIEDRRQRRAVVAARPEVAQLGQRRGVERAGHDAAMAQRRHPLDHLAGRLVGERHEQDLVGGTAPVSMA